MFLPSAVTSQQARFDDLRREAIGQLRIRQQLGDRVPEDRKPRRSLLSRIEWLGRPWR